MKGERNISTQKILKHAMAGRGLPELEFQTLLHTRKNSSTSTCLSKPGSEPPAPVLEQSLLRPSCTSGQKKVLGQWVEPEGGAWAQPLPAPNSSSNQEDFPTLQDSGPQYSPTTFAITQWEFLPVSSWRKPRWPTWLVVPSPFPQEPSMELRG